MAQTTARMGIGGGGRICRPIENIVLVEAEDKVEWRHGSGKYSGTGHSAYYLYN